jgi:hypothetical protein
VSIRSSLRSSHECRQKCAVLVRILSGRVVDLRQQPFGLDREGFVGQHLRREGVFAQPLTESYIECARTPFVLFVKGTAIKNHTV